MDDSVKSASRLEVSVSFGRFENDALSWEKWSSFSPNKYLEEVGNLSTPGSVAQKKAYFEAHYKKIAARKAEELEQEKSMGPFTLGPIAPSKEDCFENSPERESKFDLSNGEKLDEKFATEESNETKDDHNDGLSEGDEQRVCTNGFVYAINSDEEKVDDSDVVKCESSKTEDARDELNVNVDEPELNVGNDSGSVGLGTPQKDSRDDDVAEKCPERKNGRGQTSVLKKENSKLSARNITQKVTPIKKERNSVVTKKKNVSPVTKPSQAATPLCSKPKSMPTPISASQSSKKKANGSPLPKSNNISVVESKKNAPTSLHMSLSLGPQNSLGSLSMTRKSLIMERMGDKDIVKRAFKTFQNRSINGSTTDEKPSTVKHVSSTASGPNVSTFHTPTKRNIGPRKDTEKTATPRTHPGTKSNPLPSGSHKSSAQGRKNTTAFSPSIGLKSDEKSVRRKEFLKKLEAKSIAREVANAQLSAKSRLQAGVANEIHQQPTLSR